MTQASNVARWTLVLLGIVTTARLGVWQLQRNITRNQGREAALLAVDLPPLTSGVSADQAWRWAQLRGTWTGQPSLLSGAWELGRPGYTVLQPLRLQDGTVVVVERGFTTLEGVGAALAPPGSEGAVEGMLHPTDASTGTSPFPALREGALVWPPRARADIVAHTSGAAPGLTLRSATPDDGLTVPAVDRVPPYDSTSRDYAIQWFAICAIFTTLGARLAFSRAEHDRR